MRAAKSTAEGRVKVVLWSTQFAEDRDCIPEGFMATADLPRSVQDCGKFSSKRRYPLLADILQALFDSSEAEYLIFTNVDIALMPDFYRRVDDLIASGNDSLIINRRRIPAIYDSAEQLDAMYQVKGKAHPGFDCFVFHRSLLPKFQLGHICIGVPFIGIGLAQNLFCYGKNFRLVKDEHLTFHIGMEIFKGRAPKEYFQHNRKEFWGAIARMWDDLDSRKFPYGKQWLPFRLLRWGLHPSLPIRLGLALEPRRLWGLKGRPPQIK